MDSNRLRVATCMETSVGVLPNTPRFRTARITGESLSYSPDFVDSEEMRSDRMMGDAVQVFRSNSGGINFELSYPEDNTTLSDIIKSAMFNAWTNTPSRDNDGTADSVITDAGTAPNTFAFTTGAAFVVGQLVRSTGFAQAANNGLFPVTTGGATSFVSTGSALTAEAAPAANARLKVVGIQGVAGDIVATSTGLTSTTLDFVACGIKLGMWLKHGGTGANFRFSTNAANNDWARVVSVSAHAITLDNRPSGWAADTGATKTIRIFFGDVIQNGVTEQSMAVEKSYLDQQVPTYLLQLGMEVNQLSLTFQTRRQITGSAQFMGTAALVGSTPNGSSYDPATTNPVMNANVSVGRIAENNAPVAAPNWVRSFTLQYTNNVRMIEAIGNASAVDLGSGSIEATGTVETYFGDSSLYTKLINGTASSLSIRSNAGGQAIVLTLPRVLYTAGSPNAQARNQDVTLPLTYKASLDPLTNCEMQFDRLEYYE